MKFQRRPVQVEATPIDFLLAIGRTEPEIMPDWIQAALAQGKIMIYEEVVVVNTTNGKVRAGAGDWLLQGDHGEVFTCEGEIFAETYEQVGL